MPNLPVLVDQTVLAVGAGGLLYAGTITTAAVTALLTRNAGRRRAAIEVLRVLLRRPDSSR